MGLEEEERKEKGLEATIDELLEEAEKAAKEGDVHSATSRAYRARDLATDLDPEYRRRVVKRFDEIVTNAYSHEKQYLKEAEQHTKKGHFQDAEVCYWLALEAARHKSREKREEVEKRVYEGRRNIALERAKLATEKAANQEYEYAAALVDMAEDYINDAYQGIEAQRRWARQLGKTKASIDDELKAKREELKDAQKVVDSARGAIKRANYAPFPEDIPFSELEEDVRATYPTEHYKDRVINFY